MGTSGGTKHEEATRRLLEEGARSYLEASVALVAFETEVQKRCRSVLENHIDEYASAMIIKPPLKWSEIMSMVWPTEEGVQDWRSVGVQIVRKDSVPGIRNWATYCLLYWQDAEPGVECWITEWFRPKSMAEMVCLKFQELNAAVWGDGNEVGLGKKLKVEEASTFDAVLEDLLDQWVKLWKKAGGIKGVFKT